jgi:hypothetical protein
LKCKGVGHCHSPTSNFSKKNYATTHTHEKGKFKEVQALKLWIQTILNFESARKNSKLWKEQTMVVKQPWCVHNNHQHVYFVPNEHIKNLSLNLPSSNKAKQPTTKYPWHYIQNKNANWILFITWKKLHQVEI